jgi:hypothetical protein
MSDPGYGDRVEYDGSVWTVRDRYAANGGGERVRLRSHSGHETHADVADVCVVATAAERLTGD